MQYINRFQYGYYRKGEPLYIDGDLFIMNGGISIYIGLDNTKEENMDLMKKSSSLGLKRIFTSFHIPETDMRTFKDEVEETLKLACELGMDVISDISPAAMVILSSLDMAGQKKNIEANALDLAFLKSLGIATIRLDHGFAAKRIADLSHDDSGMKLQFNASAITEEFLQELKAEGVDFSRIDALHNFYPRENTGLAEDFFLKKTKMLQDCGIKVSAFVPSFNRPRSPIKAGLPTLELHRGCSFDHAVRHLIALGIDGIIISDSLPTMEEMKCLGEMEIGQINLRPRYLTSDPVILDLLQRRYHTRPDDARDVWRAEESRGLCKEMKLTVEPENTAIRNKGCVTVDNRRYERYMGEIQILKRDLSADERVNVVALLQEEEQELLQYLRPGGVFRLL